MKKGIVVGGGLAGLAATFNLCKQGYSVQLISLTHVRRSHSVCAQGGINAAVNPCDPTDSPLVHAYETIKAGDFLANQPPVLEMCLTAPSILRMLDHFGCPFNRTPTGDLDFRQFGGTLHKRTAFCGASTGQQLLYSFDEQVRRYEALNRVEKFEHHEFLRLILDDSGITRGIVMHDLHDLRLIALHADAVVIATGGLGFLYKYSTNSTFCTGAANGRLYLQGMRYANGEFIQIHPTAIPGEDKMRLMSESLRGEGGRIWVPGDATKEILFPDGSVRPCGENGKPWYFLEEMYPAFGNLVPRDIGARELLRVCELGLGIDKKRQVYLDVTHLPIEQQNKLESVLDTYYKFTGENPRKVPMKIFPAIHYTMGGAWVDWPAADDPDRETRYRQMTNIPGCFNAGESDFQYHGANRLGANSLLSCIFAGLTAGTEAARYLATTHPLPSKKATEASLHEELCIQKQLLNTKGAENIHKLHEELAESMIRHVSVKRDNATLLETIHKIKELRDRTRSLSLDDRGKTLNQTYLFAHQFRGMIELALVITKGALLRNESRGSHYKPEFSKRDDTCWLKTTIATYDPNQDEPIFSYEPVDTRHFEPQERTYLKTSTGIPEIKNLPPQHDNYL